MPISSRSYTVQITHCRFSYLQVTWLEPTSNEAGSYVCRITSVAVGGQGVEFKSTVQIDAVSGVCVHLYIPETVVIHRYLMMLKTCFWNHTDMIWCNIFFKNVILYFWKIWILTRWNPNNAILILFWPNSREVKDHVWHLRNVPTLSQGCHRCWLV